MQLKHKKRMDEVLKGLDIPANLTESEIKWIYKTQKKKGFLIYKPIYKKYNEIFSNVIKESTKIESVFEAFKDTSVFERYMLNAAQFSAAKTDAETKLLKAAVFNEDKVIKDFSTFKKDAEAIISITQKTWLRTEYEVCRRNAVMGEKWRGMVDDSDMYGYWVYETTGDDRVRDEHAELNGKVFKIGDPEGDDIFPENDWNCRCTGEPVDEDHIDENKLSVSKGKDYIHNVAEQFRYNAGNQGTLPKDGSYFSDMSNANDLKGDDFEDD